ncbi:sigma-54 interaction domain-containing protein [Kaarinaea lacus]
MSSTNSNTNFVGDSAEIQSLLRTARLVAATDATVLIKGETGSGKELLAHSIHQNSRRDHKSFNIINCAALPEHLVEAELFGHRKGAFTGAHQDHPGRFRSTNGGTVFLDEIGEIPLALQAKLLRFLESGECQAVGETHPYDVDVRVIAASNRDLYTMVQKGEFREDLFYRLHIVPLELPPLRQRNGDITNLLAHFTQEFARKHQLQAPSYNSAAQKLLCTYAWPGNVRELKNFCERMVILLSGREIAPENLPFEFKPKTANQDSNKAANRIETASSLSQMEVQMIQQALLDAGGNRSKAARLLGITRDTLLYRMKKYALS